MAQHGGGSAERIPSSGWPSSLYLGLFGPGTPKSKRLLFTVSRGPQSVRVSDSCNDCLDHAYTFLASFATRALPVYPDCFMPNTPLMISVGHAEICCMGVRTSCLIGFRRNSLVLVSQKSTETTTQTNHSMVVLFRTGI